jgi:hypothetical protein
METAAAPAEIFHKPGWNALKRIGIGIALCVETLVGHPCLLSCLYRVNQLHV